MKSSDDTHATRRRADLTGLGLAGVGLMVSVFVALLTGSLILGALYGIVPGVVLGVLARTRILRDAGLTRERSSDTQDRGRA